MSESILDIQNVSKSFGGLDAVDGVSLSIKKGSIIGLIGPNGSGKSTLFNLVSGLLKKDKGRVFFEGKPIDDLPPHKINDLGLGRGFQTPRLFSGMTVLDNTMTSAKKQTGEGPFESLRRRRWEPQERSLAEKAKEDLSLLEIQDLYSKSAAEISGGQMKLLQLGLCLMGEPKMLLLDEPTAGVAPHLANDIFAYIEAERKEQGTTFFIIEHRLDVLFKHVDHVFVLDEGRVISEGDPDEVVRDRKVIEAYLGG